MFQPIRVAVCGRKNAPPLFETLEVLGRETCLKRIDQAIEMLQCGSLSNRHMNHDRPTLNHAERPSNFIREIILEDLKTNKYRRPRAHALSAGAERLSAHRPRQIHLPELRPGRRSSAARCNLRFDDTNPSKEETEYVDSIIEDVRWLGGDWEDRLFYASDYFDQLYDWARAADQGRQSLRLRSDAPMKCASTAAR